MDPRPMGIHIHGSTHTHIQEQSPKTSRLAQRTQTWTIQNTKNTQRTNAPNVVEYTHTTNQKRSKEEANRPCVQNPHNTEHQNT